MSDLEEQIERAVAAKSGNTEFVLYRWAADEWSAYIGNPSKYVSMLEAGADFEGKGETPSAAVHDLIRVMWLNGEEGTAQWL